MDRDLENLVGSNVCLWMTGEPVFLGNLQRVDEYKVVLTQVIQVGIVADPQTFMLDGRVTICDFFPPDEPVIFNTSHVLCITKFHPELPRAPAPSKTETL